MKPLQKLGKPSVIFLLICGVVALCIWYTRPLSVNSLTHGDDIISVSVNSITFQHNDYGSDIKKSFFTKESNEIESIVELLNRYKLRRTLPFVKHISYQGDAIGKNGLTLISVYISTDSANPRLVTFEISQNGRISLNDNPANVGYFTKRKAVELFGALLDIVEQKGSPVDPT